MILTGFVIHMKADGFSVMEETKMCNSAKSVEENFPITVNANLIG